MAELEAALDAIARAWRPRDRGRLLDTLRPRAEALAEAVVWVLEHRDHPRLAATIGFAADLRVGAALPELRTLARSGPPAVHAAAIVAAEALEPWTTAELSDLLLDGSRAGRLAVLELCAGRADRPATAIEDLLGDDDAAVRGAALAALPDALSERAMRECLALADADNASSESARGTLARARLDESQRAWLAGQLATASPLTQLAVIAGGGIQTPDNERVVWSIAQSGDADARVKALELLDAAGCQDTTRVRSVLPGLPPAGLYRAARCLVRAGDRDGVALLLDLAENPADDAADARAAARQVLAELSGIAAAGPTDAWRAWFSSALPVGGLTLPSGPRR